MPRRFSLQTSAAALLLAATATAPLFVTRARAAWPPPEDATADDMKKPDHWPNDPDYGWNAAEEREGQWNYFSFMVEPNEARPEEKATGMSIDLAWRLTATELKDGSAVAGHPSVLIGVTDSGIEWDRDDLVEAAYLNHLELATHRPTRADGTACGELDPAFFRHSDASAEALAGFDCNGDGILSVADYLETSSLTPAASEGRPLGDRNANGKLDAGDLIQNFSDGIDDDGNGYVDDISGWDFFKDDNDPYDDTRYGHGTGEGVDSMARANNGIGGAGGCNGCRMLQLRVGDSFITDVTDFAQAVVYATDMKAKVVQSALGTVNMNKFTQEALDYAYEQGVLTVASMADENSRHHNMPTASNHTMPVHAIQPSADSIFQADTFLEYHPCSNFGGQNYLSASGTSCSSEAVGQTSGIAGLVYSAGIKYDRGLTASEAMQLVMMTADDIDVPESRLPEPEGKWSQPGFDQRFGYGRVNANTAVEWVRDGKIPPEVDVTSPTWFTVLYKDQVVAPIDIVGTVAAKRADSYDWSVEWAPGVQPLDDEFEAIAGDTNVASDVVMGEDGPLAALDIRSIDPTHPRDVDSPMGENDYTITVRVRAVAHYGGDIGDVPGEIRRTYYVHSDPDLAKGFPIWMGAGGEGSPKMADMDGDGVRELIYPTAAGELHVLKITPSGPESLPGFPFKTEHARGMSTREGEPSYLASPGYDGGHVDLDVTRESISTSAPAVADVDGDGMNEIVLTTYAGTIYVLEHDGTVKNGWPVRLPDVPSCSQDPDAPTEGPCMGRIDEERYAIIDRGAFAAPVLEDMDQDGDYDIIQAAFDGKIYVFDASGERLPNWPVEVRYEGDLSDDPGPSRIFTTPAVADFDGDGLPEVLVGSNQKLGNGGNAGGVYLIDGRGTDAAQPKPNWPVTFTSFNLFPLVAEGVTNAGVIGTVDGQRVAIAHGNASSPVIVPLDPGGQTGLGRQPANGLPRRPDPNDPSLPYQGVDPSSIFGPLSTALQPNTMLPLFSQPSLGDMDQDGTPDIIATGGSLNLALSLANGDARPGGNLIAMWSLKTGQMLPASPMDLEDFTFLNSSAVVDLTGDGYPEALVGSGGYYVHAVDACGREAPGWPKFTGQWIIPTPAVGDLDGDDTLEVAIGTRNGWLYVWHTQAPDTNLIEWESYHHDNRNTGNLDVPLEQGGEPTAKKPLTPEVCTEVPTEEEDELTYGASGGCACEAAGDPSRGAGGAALAGLALLGAVVARRRRRAA